MNRFVYNECRINGYKLPTPLLVHISILQNHWPFHHWDQFETKQNKQYLDNWLTGRELTLADINWH